MRLKIHFDEEISSSIYHEYCRFLYYSIKEDIRSLTNPLKYRVRERQVLESSILTESSIRPIKRINLERCIDNCLVLRREKGEYVIQLDERSRVPGTTLKVSTLVRLVEYGNETILPYPVVRRVLEAYRLHYKEMMIDFMKERLME